MCSGAADRRLVSGDVPPVSPRRVPLSGARLLEGQTAGWRADHHPRLHHDNRDPLQGGFLQSELSLGLWDVQWRLIILRTSLIWQKSRQVNFPESKPKYKEPQEEEAPFSILLWKYENNITIKEFKTTIFSRFVSFLNVLLYKLKNINLKHLLKMVALNF